MDYKLKKNMAYKIKKIPWNTNKKNTMAYKIKKKYHGIQIKKHHGIQNKKNTMAYKIKKNTMEYK
jgi:hypothetical protein